MFGLGVGTLPVPCGRVGSLVAFGVGIAVGGGCDRPSRGPDVVETGENQRKRGNWVGLVQRWKRRTGQGLGWWNLG